MNRMKIDFREATGEDIAEIIAIEKASFEFPWSEEMFLNQMKLKGIAAVIVAEIEDALAGYSIVWFEGPDSHILNIAVDPSFRRRGVASGILEEVIRRSRKKGCSRLYLEVRKGNRPASDFYLAKGFKLKGIIEGYYQENGEDAIVLELPLE
jgi:ribosomal-protein-alanine N-acetyltransferase